MASVMEQAAQTLTALPTRRAARPRAAIVTVGQSPRDDVVPDILARLPFAVEVSEQGALDGLSAAEIAALAPAPGDLSLATRLRDGTPVVVSKRAIGDRLAAMLAGIPPGSVDLVVILSTGLFREFESRCPMVNAQRAIDSAVDALAGAGQRIGLVQPIDRQVGEAQLGLRGLDLAVASIGAHQSGDFARLATELASCDILVLNSIAFDEDDRRRLSQASGKPVLLARRVVAGAMRLLLDTAAGQPGGPRRRREVEERTLRLTPRERQVMSLMTEGLANKAIARQLGISPRTVEIHRAKVLEKMEVDSTGALIRLVLSPEL